MTNKIQIRRGLKSKLPNLSAGEPAHATDTGETFIGSGYGNVHMDGDKWFSGAAMSGTSTNTTYSYSACPAVKVGDKYLNTSNGNWYECTTAGSGTAAKWTYKGCLRGPQGPEGKAPSIVKLPELPIVEYNTSTGRARIGGDIQPATGTMYMVNEAEDWFDGMADTYNELFWHFTHTENAKSSVEKGESVVLIFGKRPTDDEPDSGTVLVLPLD